MAAALGSRPVPAFAPHCSAFGIQESEQGDPGEAKKLLQTFSSWLTCSCRPHCHPQTFKDLTSFVLLLPPRVLFKQKFTFTVWGAVALNRL